MVGDSAAIVASGCSPQSGGCPEPHGLSGRQGLSHRKLLPKDVPMHSGTPERVQGSTAGLTDHLPRACGRGWRRLWANGYSGGLPDSLPLHARVLATKGAALVDFGSGASSGNPVTYG